MGSPGMMPVSCSRVATLVVCALGLLAPVAGAQRVTPVYGVHYGAPLKWSAVIGIGLRKTTSESTVFVAGEPGIGGWRASLGYTRMMSDLGSGYSLRASYLHTRTRAWLVDPDESFVGGELHFMPVFGLGARAGGFVRVDAAARTALFTADVSFAL